MNYGLRFTDYLLFGIGIVLFWVVCAYASGMQPAEMQQQVISSIHSISSFFNETSHGAHVARHALGQSVGNMNYVMQGHSVIPSGQ